MKKTRFIPAILAVLALAAGSASATVTFGSGITGTVSELNNSTELFFSGNQSSTDLINGVVATSVSGWTNVNGASVPQLNDGIHGVSYFTAGDLVEGSFTSVDATATFNLGVGANNLGFDITSLRSIAAWVNVNFGNQAWTLETQPVGGGAFTTAVTANYQPLTGGIGATQVLLTDLNITGVQAVRITANSVNGGANGGNFVFREFDVIGASTIPEPSAALLGAFGALALLRRRR